MKSNTVTVTTRQQRKSTKKPSVEISLLKAKRLLKQAELNIEDGECYTIYSCGHVFDNRDDPQIITYYVGENRGIRSCPICINQKLLTKFKRCGCGAEHIGKRVQPSECCGKCPSVRKATGRDETLNAFKRNGHLADPDRVFCIYRSECLDIYRVYDAVPCKGCKQYKVHQGAHDGVMIVR